MNGVRRNGLQSIGRETWGQKTLTQPLSEIRKEKKVPELRQSDSGGVGRRKGEITPTQRKKSIFNPCEEDTAKRKKAIW